MGIVAAGCTKADDGIKLVMPGDQSVARVTTLDTSRHQPHSYGALQVCTSGAGSVVIDAVELSGGNGGTKLTRFAIRPARAPGEAVRSGAAKGPLESLGFHATAPVKVLTACYDGDPADQYDASRHLTELAIEVERVTPGTGSFDALTVRYSDAGRQRLLEIPFGVTLCVKGDRSTQNCSQQ